MSTFKQPFTVHPCYKWMVITYDVGHHKIKKGVPQAPITISYFYCYQYAIKFKVYKEAEGYITIIYPLDD